MKMTKWKQYFLKKKIDERQQADLNRVTAFGFWIMFYMLLISIVVQSMFLGRPSREWMAEWVILIVMAVYEVTSCYKIGVWSQYNQSPKVKHYLLYSTIGGGVSAVCMTAANARNWTPEIGTTFNLVLVFTATFVIMFVFTFAVFLVVGTYYNHRRRMMDEKLNRELEEEDD